MASFFSSVRQGFGRQASRSPNPQQQQERGHVPPPLSSSSSLAGTVPQNLISTSPVPPSPSIPTNMSLPDSNSNVSPSRKPPYFFREEYANLVVKGNFMTLAAVPTHVEKGEWLAHQIVEQYRLLDSMIQIVKVIDEKTGLPVCNPEVCPTMSASGHTYTWLDNAKRPIKIPACQYIQLVQKWILTKISDPKLFPTDTNNLAVTASAYPSGGLNTPHSSTPIPAGPTSLNMPLNQLAGRDWLGKSSGFPENFEGDIRSIYRQMMRCYAHLYHGHWLRPFWDVNAYKELNTCFIHFVNVGKQFELLGDKEMEPMQPLIDLWLQKGYLPAIPQHQPAQHQPVPMQMQMQQNQPTQMGPPQI